MNDLTMVPDHASAVVELTVEVHMAAAWGKDCTVEQVVSQATREATEKLRKTLTDEKVIRVVSARCVRVVCNAKRP